MKKHLLIQAFILSIVIIGVTILRVLNTDNAANEIDMQDNVALYDHKSLDYQGKNIEFIINNTTNNLNLIKTMKDSAIVYKYFMIVRFSDINCSSCRNVDMPILSMVNRDSIYVIYTSSYTNEDDVNFFKRVNQLDGDILLIDTPFLSIDSELINSNYYLLLNDKLMISEFFVASPYHIERTKAFFKRVFPNL